MAASDRLQELACECRDNEEALERMRREVAALERAKAAGLALAHAVEDEYGSWGADVPNRLARAVSEVRNAK